MVLQRKTYCVVMRMSSKYVQPFVVYQKVDSIKLIYQPPYSNKYYGVSGYKNYPHTEREMFRKCFYNGNGWCHETYYAQVSLQCTDSLGEKLELDITDYVRNKMNQQRLTSKAVNRISKHLPTSVYVKEGSHGYYIHD